MGQNFNDNELADIMNEIESLENGAESPKEAVQEVVYEEDEQEVMAELAELPIEKAVGEEVEQVQESVYLNNAPSKASMNFSVEGNTTLDLSFLISNKVVQLVINKNCFEVEIEGGMKFSIPLPQDEWKKSA